jgi:hypothetical protein
MSNPEFIKKGVVEQETEAQPVKTASDEIFEKVKTCTPACRCSCKIKQQEDQNEQSK